MTTKQQIDKAIEIVNQFNTDSHMPSSTAEAMKMYRTVVKRSFAILFSSTDPEFNRPQFEAACEPDCTCESKWDAGHRIGGWIVCGRCSGLVGRR